MQFSSLKSGDVMKIGNEKFEVLFWQIEADAARQGQNVKTFRAVYLHKAGSDSLHPTHMLQNYPNAREAFLFKLQQDKLPGSRQRGPSSIRREITVGQIEILKKAG